MWLVGRRIPPAVLCRAAVLGDDQAYALEVCRNEYARTNDPLTGAMLANEFRRNGAIDAARDLATRLFASVAYPKAAQVLGRAKFETGDMSGARAFYALARTAHARAGALAELAIDDQLLGGTYLKEARYPEALGALDLCITEAVLIWLPDVRVAAMYCHTSTAFALLEIGHFAAAKQELDRAERMALTPRHLAELNLRQGELEQRFGLGPRRLPHHQLAAMHFRAALQRAQQAKVPRVAMSAELNLARELIELGELTEAHEHLENIRRIDTDGQDADTITRLEALIAFRRGDLVGARALATSAYDVDQEEQFHACVMLSEVALARHSYEEAAVWARCGVALTEAVRNSQTALELRALLLSAHRRPYELWFVALVRQGKLADAVAAFDQWQGRSLLDAAERARTSSPSRLHEVVLRDARFREILPELSRAPIARTVAPKELLDGMRGVDVIALVEADDTIWRITDHHGALAIHEVGSSDALRPQIEFFTGHPAESRGDDLGTRLLGPEAFRATEEAVLLVLDSELGNLPAPALSSNGHPLIEFRPIVRAPRLSELGCVPAMTSPLRATVLANAGDDLPAATVEAQEVAARFGVTAQTGARATRQALLAAGPGELLHVATHVDLRLGGSFVALHDESVSALEIANAGPGPRFAFLAACGSAVADDSEIAGSVAMAFLARGTPQVIATVQAVSDLDAARLSRAFYKDVAVKDPARALRRAQLQAAREHNQYWPFYMLFGHDICRKDLP